MTCLDWTCGLFWTLGSRKEETQPRGLGSSRHPTGQILGLQFANIAKLFNTVYTTLYWPLDEMVLMVL
jgi:hypothetical protein